ncbi:MAG TPA: metal-dependent transcriptional regulator [Bacillota bacterium]|nr:metal-dependent transcriptional regulator [Bacillota bacterium]
MHLQESGEMYLETVYILSKKSSAVRSLDVAEYMNYSKPSVSRAVGLLKEGGYLEMDADGLLTLTEKGLSAAAKTYERHTVLSELFISIGVPEDIAVSDACKIEHDISDETFEALKKHAQSTACKH